MSDGKMKDFIERYHAMWKLYNNEYLEKDLVFEIMRTILFEIIAYMTEILEKRDKAQIQENEEQATDRFKKRLESGFYRDRNGKSIVVKEGMNKEQINTVVSALDKIRVEIVDCLKALDDIEKSGLNIYLPNEMSGRRLTYQQCLGFIDKYKAEIKSQESEDEESCDNCKHNTDSWDSDACDGCCGANSKWSGEIYPGEFEAMDHNGRLDALVSEEQVGNQFDIVCKGD